MLLELQCLRSVPDREVINKLLEAYLYAVEEQMGATPSVDLLECICAFFRDVSLEHFLSQAAEECSRDSRHEEKAPSTSLGRRVKAITISLLRAVVNGTELELPSTEEAVASAEEAASQVMEMGERGGGDALVAEEKSGGEEKKEGGGGGGSGDASDIKQVRGDNRRESAKFDNVQVTVRLLYSIFNKIQSFHNTRGNSEQLCGLLRTLNELLDQVGELQVEGLTEVERDGGNGTFLRVSFQMSCSSLVPWSCWYRMFHYALYTAGETFFEEVYRMALPWANEERGDLQVVSKSV